MKPVLKQNLVKTLLVLAVCGFAYLNQQYFNQTSLDISQAEAALFGVGSDEFTPYETKPESDKIAGWVKWALYAAGILLLLVLTFVFDIAAYAQKLTGKKVANANKINAWLMLIFLVVGMFFAFWELYAHGKYTKVYNSSSIHGVDYDSMFMITFILTGIVFVITQVFLFVYAFMYQHKEGRKAAYVSHNNKLEVFWTIIPAIVLTFLVLRGYEVWKDVMYKTDSKEGVQEIELFAYQFGWTARYPGFDGKFAPHSFNYISGTNELGLAERNQVALLKVELQTEIERIEEQLANQESLLEELKETVIANKRTANFKGVEETNKRIAQVKSGEYEEELLLKLRRKNKQLDRMAMMESNPETVETLFDGSVHDDFLSKEIVVVQGKPVRLKFRSRDVIHSAFLPDFRVQMNCVPGMETEFTFVPTKSTSQARAEKGEEDFNYFLYCNKICGATHFNMKIKFIVLDSETEYDSWLVNQKPLFPKSYVKETNTAEEIEVVKVEEKKEEVEQTI
jgi:cytochrome c oxidase subunit 2